MARLTLRLLLVVSIWSAACFAGAEPVGRLFLSPAERMALDQLRLRGGAAEPVAVTRAEEAPVISQLITLNGVVQRSSGKNTVWINHVPQHEFESRQGIAVVGHSVAPPTAFLQLPSGQRVHLKTGQTFNVENGDVHEAYQAVVPITPSQHHDR